MMQFVTYKSREILAKSLAAIVAGQLSAALHARNHATLAVPGGTTPGPFFNHLSQAALDWHKISILLTDERFVPIDDPRSNTKLLNETLLQGPAAAATLIPMTNAGGSPMDAIARLTPAISAALPIEICILGMGADMHIASLFPGGDNLGAALATTAPPLMTMKAKGAVEPRLTLTLPALSSANITHILIKGADKKLALEMARLSGTAFDAPVRAILAGPSDVSIHYAD